MGQHSPGGVSKGVHISNPTGGSRTAGSHKVVDSEKDSVVVVPIEELSVQNG